MNLNDLEIGKGIHGLVLGNGVEKDVVLENTMVDFYQSVVPLDTQIKSLR